MRALDEGQGYSSHVWTEWQACHYQLMIIINRNSDGTLFLCTLYNPNVSYLKQSDSGQVMFILHWSRGFELTLHVSVCEYWIFLNCMQIKTK